LSDATAILSTVSDKCSPRNQHDIRARDYRGASTEREAIAHSERTVNVSSVHTTQYTVRLRIVICVSQRGVRS